MALATWTTVLVASGRWWRRVKSTEQMDRPGIYTTLNYVHDYMYILPEEGGGFRAEALLACWSNSALYMQRCR